jgi:hypothetical protein
MRMFRILLPSLFLSFISVCLPHPLKKLTARKGAWRCLFLLHAPGPDLACKGLSSMDYTAALLTFP